MPSVAPWKTRAAVLAAAALSLTVAGCGSADPKTDAEKLARGREIVERASAQLAAAPGLSVATREVRHEDGQTFTVTRETLVRRPDRLYSKVTGDRSNEIWYDGKGVTMAMHGEKVFGQARAPETLDKALDALYERYGISPPFADYVYSKPAEALLADTTTGGWVGRETVDGQEMDHLAFEDLGVKWELWVPTRGNALPHRFTIDVAGETPRTAEVTFTSWNLAPQLADEQFTPKVPDEYEGISILQRARVLRNVTEADTQAPAAAPKP